MAHFTFHLLAVLVSAAPILSLPFSVAPSKEGESSPTDGTVPSSGIQHVRLRKRQARELQALEISGPSAARSSFYTARVFVGQPQAQMLHVTLDTASGGVTLPSTSCTSLACLEHRKYRPELSALAVDINADGALVEDGQRLAPNAAERDAITIGFSSLDLGDGSVTGKFLADSVCLQTDASIANHTQHLGKHPPHPKWPSAACAEVGLVAATELSDIPFRAAPYDGSIGLGMHGLSIGKAFSFIETLSQASVTASNESSTPEHAQLPQFALFHGRKFGEASFGGHNPKRLASPLQWAPAVKPEEGYWQVSILGIRIGNQSLSACKDGSCRGIIDSCTSKIGVPANMMSDFEVALSGSLGLRQDGKVCIGPDLTVELSGGIQLTLKAEDYAQSGAVECEPSLASLDLPESFAGVFILGDSLLRRYYTVFDWTEGAQQIGFGLAAAVAEDGEEERSAAAAEAAEDVEEASMNTLARVQDLALPGLLQALLIRVMVVLCMVFFSTHIISGRAFTSFVESMLAYRGLLLEFATHATVVPASEAPDSDECVICLGSCEDDPAAIRGVPGLKSAVSEEEDGCCAVKSKGSQAPKWRRLSCGHHFHETCIFEWLRKARQCPTCRCPLKGTGATIELGIRSRLSDWFPLLNVVHNGVMAVNQTQ